MKREELIKEALYLTTTLAYNPSVQFYEEECNEELDINQRKYIGDTFAEFLMVLNEQFLRNSYKKHEEHRLHLLFGPYVYCIEKGVEVAYNLRKGINKSVDFRGTDIGTGIVGNALEDEVIPFMIEPIQRIGVLMEEVYYALEYDKLVTSKTRKYVYEAMLWGAVYAGIELCLRMDL